MSASLSEQISLKFPIFSLALTQARFKRANWGLGIAMFVPIVQYGLLLFFADTNYSDGGFDAWYYRIYFNIILFFLVSLVTLLVGTGMYRDLMSDDTIVYIMTKPIRRERIYFEMFFAYLLISYIIVTPGIVTYHIVGDILIRIYDTKFSITIAQSSINLIYEVFGAYLLLTGLGAVFVTTGLGLKRPLLINLLIAFGIILQQFGIDLISNQYEPVYISQTVVSSWLVGFSENAEISKVLARSSVGVGYDPPGLLLNFVIILGLTLLIGYYVARRKQLN